MCHVPRALVVSAAHDIVGRAYREVSAAAKPYESRWTLRALAVVDRELYLRFREQQALWEQALLAGTADEVSEQTAAMCRGWAAIALRLDQADAPDDAYMIGVCPRTGTRVAIGDQVAARDRVREIEGERTIWLTPHEVATLLGSQQALASLKNIFPGAELIDLYPGEPAKEDA